VALERRQQQVEDERRRREDAEMSRCTFSPHMLTKSRGRPASAMASDASGASSSGRAKLADPDSLQAMLERIRRDADDSVSFGSTPLARPRVPTGLSPHSDGEGADVSLMERFLLKGELVSAADVARTEIGSDGADPEAAALQAEIDMLEERLQRMRTGGGRDDDSQEQKQRYEQSQHTVMPPTLRELENEVLSMAHGWRQGVAGNYA
jgi:hypothetical protein